MAFWRDASTGVWTMLNLLALAGCAGTAPIESAPVERRIEGLEKYMPLRDGFVYQYDVETDAGETGRMMVQVVRPRPGLAELNVAGKVQRLEVSADAVRHATGGYLLKVPLEVGSEWKGQFGRVRVISVERAIQTPAGDFQNCVETVEEATVPTAKRASSVFCLDVGMVALTIEAMMEGESMSVETRLRSFGPAATGLE
jgi:hypothetical protein